jgi:hypothetical protein
MHDFLTSLPEQTLGIIYMVLGTLILLDSMGIIHVHILVIIIALLAIANGFFLVHGPKKLQHLLDRVQIKHKK